MTVLDTAILRALGVQSTAIDGERVKAVFPADAWRQVVACVNACAGISTPRLEAFAFAMKPASDSPFDRLATNEAWRTLRTPQPGEG